MLCTMKKPKKTLRRSITSPEKDSATDPELDDGFFCFSSRFDEFGMRSDEDRSEPEPMNPQGLPKF